MTHLGKEQKFFLGTNTSFGFFSKFFQLYNPQRYKNQYIIKAGAGSGKSTFMKKIAKKLRESGFDVLLFPCSADPHSLDAVVCEALSFTICDGTAPHVVEPQFPGAVEQVLSFYPAQDNLALTKHREDLILHTLDNQRYHRRCQPYLAALSSVLLDTQALVSPFLHHHKIQKYCKNLMTKQFKSTKNSSSLEDIRFLSTITLNGVEFFEDTPFSLASHVIEIKDVYGVVSHPILSHLRQESLKQGYHIITSYCPLSNEGKIEHLYIRELDTYFVTSNHYHFLSSPPTKTIHASRFLDMDKIRLLKSKLAFNKKLALTIIHQIVHLQTLAKASHDKMEDIYIPNMDFSFIDSIYEDLIADLPIT